MSSQTQEQSAKRTYDYAVDLIDREPGVATSHFRRISHDDTAGTMFQRAATEQLINCYWKQGRIDLVEAECRRLMGELKHIPEASVLWARTAVRLAEVMIMDGRESEPEVMETLERAERIFEANADFHFVGKILEYKSTITAETDYTQAERQLALGTTLASVHLTSVIPDSARTAPGVTPELAFAGNSSNN